MNNRQLSRVPGAQWKSHMGNVYIISENNKLVSDISKLLGQSASGMFYMQYSPVCINDVSKVSDNILAETVESYGANVFMQVFMPDQDAPVFMFELCDQSSIGLTVMDMINSAEDLAVESACSAIRNYALNQPENCTAWLSSSEEDVSSVLRETIASEDKMGPSFKGACHYSSELSPQQEKIMKKFQDARDNFVKYVLEIQEGKSANIAETEEKVDFVLKELTVGQKNKILKLYLKKMTIDGVNDFFNDFINHKAIVANSKIKLSVEKFDDCIKNDGFYRLCYQFADFEKRPLHFKHKSACVIYLMLLISRKKDKDMNTFFLFDGNNTDDMDLFVKLMDAVYGIKSEPATLDYKNLFKDDDSGQGRLKDYIKNCKDLIDKSISKYESPYPFIPKRLSYNGKEFVLPILPKNIVFSDVFKKKLSL